MTHRSHVLLCLALALGPGCVGSPQPSPPNLAPDSVSRGGNMADISDGVEIVADPGAVTPAEGSVVITNLDRPDPPVSEPVMPDGSFVVRIDGFPSDEYRIQIRNGGARSAPLDVRGDLLEADLSVEPDPLACLTLEPAFELDLGEARGGDEVTDVVVAHNDCASEVTLSAGVREPGAPVAVTLPDPIAAGASAEVQIRVTAPASGQLEATLFVIATAPERDRRPLTLFLRGTD